MYTREAKERGPHVDKPPTQRYLEIITAGCKHHGVDEEYIKYLNGLEMQKRHLPEEFRGWPKPDESLPLMVTDEFADQNGKDGKRIIGSVNGKVLEFCPENKDGEHWDQWLGFRNALGANFEVGLARNGYDPKYGAPDKLEDFTREHSAYVEDFIYCMNETNGCLADIKVIGRFEQQYKD